VLAVGVWRRVRRRVHAMAIGIMAPCPLKGANVSEALPTIDDTNSRRANGPEARVGRPELGKR
jgi:hypothetical protein